MFETVFVPRQRGRAASAIALSAAAQSLAITGLMMTSLVFSEALPIHRLVGVFAPSVPPPRPSARPVRSSSGRVASLSPRTLLLPLDRPAPAVAALDFAGEEPSLAGGVPGGLPGAGVPGGLGPVGTVGPAVKPAPPPPPRPADPPKTSSEAIPHVRVGGLIQAARLTYQVKPVYPTLARQARVQGTVKLEAVIDREGRIRNLRVLSGPPLLVKAAVDAVLQWRYEPTYLNSVPAEVLTQVDVNFTLLP